VDYSLDTSTTARGGQNYSGTANINYVVVPGRFAVRASFSSTENSGWINHYTQTIVDGASVGGGAIDHRRVNSERTQTAHITGRLELDGDLTITPALFVQHTYVNDSSAFYLNTPGLGRYDQNKQVREYGRDDVSLASLNIHKGLGFADFTAITGLFQRNHNRVEDGTFFNSTTFAEAFLAPLSDVCPTCAPLPSPVDPTISPTTAINILGNLPSAVHLKTKYVQFTQELRLSSPDKGKDARLKWVVGLYFAQQKVHNTDFQQIPTINSTFKRLYGLTMEQSGVESAYNGGVDNTVLFPNDIDEADDRTYKETQYAAFGQVDYVLAPSWRVGLGGRVETAAEHFDSTEIGFYQIGNISPYHQSAKATSFTPKLTLSHDLDTDRTVYASVGEGFRLGGPTGPITFGPNTVCAGDFAAINQTTQPTKFGSDSLWTYELGSKGRLFGNRLSFGAAAFYTNWKNIQQQIYLPTCGYYFTENVGDAAIYGGEVEATFKVTSHLRLSVNASSESASITRSINPIDVPKGATLINVPVGTATASMVYARDLNDRLRLTARADYDWTGRSHGSYQSTSANYYNPSYGVLNASLAINVAAVEISLYGRNLLNDKTIIQSPQINTVVQGYTVHPRVVGVSLRSTF
jgi:outer membrane receptor protein involved in Fe transport